MAIYLDNAATTRVCPEAAEAALRMMTEVYGNPSATYAPGRAARAEVEAAREKIAAALGCKADAVYFTSCGSEGDNWALISGARLMRRQGRHIISSAAEHDAIRKSLDALEADGFQVTRLSPGPDGSIAADAVLDALRDDTVLVSLMLVNNETGAVTDIRKISKALEAAGSRALLHTDAVQGFMKIPFTAKELGADMITVSGHKIHAPKGVGALYVRSGLRLPPLMLGGGQEEGKRSGTENLPGIAAFAAAVKAALADRDAGDRIAGLRNKAVSLLTEGAPDLVVIGGGAPHILNISLPGYRSEVLLNWLDGKGICVSKGSACKRGSRSHVLEAMSLPPRVIDGAIRVSLSRLTTEADIDFFCAELLRARDGLYKSL